MLKQMGEDNGNIDALMKGGHYDPSTVTDGGEGADVTPNEKSMYQGNKSPRVAGGTAGFKGVPDAFSTVEPYPEIDKDIYGGEPIGAGLQAGDLRPVTTGPGNSSIVGGMGGMPRDGSFSGPAKIGAGDMVSDYMAGEASDAGAEDTFVAPLVGNLVAGMPTDDAPREQNMRTRVAPEGLVTGQVKGGYAPGVGHDSTSTENPYAAGHNVTGDKR